MNKNLLNQTLRILVLLVLTVNLAAAPLKKSGGNVQVRVENGNLILLGDEQDNNIILTEGGVSGRAGTTVNGESHIFIPEGVTSDVQIDMKGGNDFIRVELPGTNFALPHDLEIHTGAGNDTLELLQVKAPNDTRIETGAGNDIVFIDGVMSFSQYIRSEFTGTFAVRTGNGEDLLEFHNAIFHSEVDVQLGSGMDGACSTGDSEFQLPEQAHFNGGAPSGFPGDGFVAPSVQFTNITDFENFPDDCSFLGGRF